MLFNSWVFLAFFLLVYTAYLLSKRNFKIQNLILLGASYVFYGWWDWRFLLLLAFSTTVDFNIARKLDSETNPSKRKWLLAISVVFNLSILCFFKYFNFFSESAVRALGIFGFHVDEITLKLVLPLGISFYTFQEMSYVIDVYRKEFKAASKLTDFALFVSFFPHLVAGPIQRATNLLTQIMGPRKIQTDQVNAGIFLILWGYFKKVVIADNLALIADRVFNNYTHFHGMDLFLGGLAFCFQIYGDFSGYSDIGRGLAKLMGFDLMVNFKLPYFALSPAEFWQRWHLSLSQWLRNYLYIPLGGNRRGEFNTYRNLFLTMLLGGLWHGASWNFVLWGAFHGILLAGAKFFKWDESRLPALLKMAVTFVFINAGWILFRSHSLELIVYFFSHLGFGFSPDTLQFGYQILYFTLPLIAVQILQHKTRNLLAVTELPGFVRIPVYGVLLTWILVFGVRHSMEFIYFQF